MKKLIILITFFCMISEIAVSEAFFMPNQQEVKDIYRLYSEAGRTLPFNSFPVSRNTLKRWGESLYADASKDLKSKIDDFLIELKIEDVETAELDWHLGYEHYIRTEENTLNSAADYLEESPLGMLSGSFVNYDYGGVCLDLQLKREYSTYPVNNMFISKPANPVALENQILQKGYIFFTDEQFEVVVGRLPSHYGNPHFNSMMANKNLPFLDQIKLEMNIADFRLEYYTASLENREAIGDLDVSGSLFDFGQNSIWTTMHRLYYSFDSFNMSLSEQSFVSRNNNQLYLGDFAPLSVLHNTWLGIINISMFTDFSWAIIPGLEVYLQLGFDDISASDVFGIADSSLPTIDSFIFGAYHNGNIAELPYFLKLEIGNTHYLWGSFNEMEPLEEAIYRIYLDYGNILIPFSSPYGPGAFWVEFDSNIETDFGLSGGLFFNFLSKNTLADLITTVYERADDVMADAPRDLRFELGAEINFDFLKRFHLYIEPSFLHSFERDNSGSISNETSWFELTFGGKISGHEVFNVSGN